MTDAMTDRTSSDPQPAPTPGDWSAHAVYYEYSQAADPIRGGQTTQIPARQFSADVYAGGPTRIVPLLVSLIKFCPKFTSFGSSAPRR